MFSRVALDKAYQEAGITEFQNSDDINALSLEKLYELEKKLLAISDLEFSKNDQLFRLMDFDCVTRAIHSKNPNYTPRKLNITIPKIDQPISEEASVLYFQALSLAEQLEKNHLNAHTKYSSQLRSMENKDKTCDKLNIIIFSINEILNAEQKNGKNGPESTPASPSPAVESISPSTFNTKARSVISLSLEVSNGLFCNRKNVFYRKAFSLVQSLNNLQEEKSRVKEDRLTELSRLSNQSFNNFTYLTSLSEELVNSHKIEEYFINFKEFCENLHFEHNRLIQQYLQRMDGLFKTLKTFFNCDALILTSKQTLIDALISRSKSQKTDLTLLVDLESAIKDLSDNVRIAQKINLAYAGDALKEKRKYALGILQEALTSDTLADYEKHLDRKLVPQQHSAPAAVTPAPTELKPTPSGTPSTTGLWGTLQSVSNTVTGFFASNNAPTNLGSRSPSPTK